MRDETRSSPELAERIACVLSDAVPVIEAITGLPLRQCTVRILKPARWRAEVRGFVGRGVARALADSPATAEEQQRAELMRVHWRVTTRWAWPLLPPMTITHPDGEPETIITADAVRHAGLDRTRWGLERTVIHEAVHHAQIRASRGVVVPPPSSVRPRLFSDRAAPALMEGHAAWAELHASHHLLGHWPEEEMRRISIHSAARQWLVYARARVGGRWTAWRSGEPAPVPPPRDQRRAAFQRDQPALLTPEPWLRFVQDTVSGVGDLGAWNLVWSDPALVPTDQEIHAPDTWLKRVGI